MFVDILKRCIHIYIYTLVFHNYFEMEEVKCFYYLEKNGSV